MPDLNNKIDVDEALRVLDEFRNKAGVDAGVASGNPSGVVQTGSGAAVTNKKMVMKVLLDDENYSMHGHVPLADKCFGQFYLMLDKGLEYETQSQSINQAIRSITEKEAFDLALEHAQLVLGEGAGNDDLESLRDAFFAARVATRLCMLWFDQPDDQTVEIAFEVPSFGHEPPPRCPPDFIWLSMYLFLPDQGGGKVSDPALLFGPMLKKAFLGYVTELRTSNRLPEGKLSRVIFEALSEHDDELIAQTIIGVMVGLLPPVIINILLVLQAWRASTPSRFEELKAALQQPGESDPYLRCTAVLKTPLMREMQSNPMPPAIWRTAVKEHTLGDVQIHPEDTIEIRIANATAEDHQAGTTDVFAVFGGDRSATPHPTHSCPAYEAALGIMLGTIYALMTETVSA